MKGLRSILGTTVALAGSGGVAGLAHSTPTILWKTGLTCKNIGDSGEAFPTEPGIHHKWKNGGYANLSKIGAKIGKDGVNCVKK